MSEENGFWRWNPLLVKTVDVTIKNSEHKLN